MKVQYEQKTSDVCRDLEMSDANLLLVRRRNKITCFSGDGCQAVSGDN